MLRELLVHAAGGLGRSLLGRGALDLLATAEIFD
jgi:hypothetical protein